MPLGTLFNTFTVLLGSTIGLLLGQRFPQRIKTIVFSGIGLANIVMGLQMGLKVENILVFIFSILIGGIIGELIDLDMQFGRLSDFLKTKLRSKNTQFTEGLVTAFILFCVGPYTILGTITEGFKNDHTLLFTKAFLDGFASLALASAFGSGVLFSALPLFLYQTALTLSAGFVKGYFTPHVVNQLTAVGGVLIIGIGISLLDLKRIKVANLLPALIVVVILSLFFR